MSHRIYLHSAKAQHHDDSGYDVSFHNIRVPTIGPHDQNDDGWYIRVESFEMEGITNVPMLIMTDLVNLDSFSTLNDNMPLQMVRGSSYQHVVHKGDIGHRLPCAPAKAFQSGALRIRFTDVEGTLFQLPTDETDPVLWGMVLSVYRID